MKGDGAFESRSVFMPLSLDGARQIAGEVIRGLNPGGQVLAATTAEGGSDYTEIFVSIRGCTAEPCHMVIGVNRNTSDDEFRSAVASSFTRHMSSHAWQHQAMPRHTVS